MKLWTTINMVGMFILVLSVAGQTHAASPSGLIEGHDNEMALQHDMIKDDLGDIQDAIDAVQTSVDNLQVGQSPPCGPDTEALLFVPMDNGTTICDNRSGLGWQQSPSTTPFTQQDAITHCQSLGPEWDLPHIQQLQSVVGYDNVNPALPTGHPFIIPPPDAIVTSIAYWVKTLFAGDPNNVGWAIAFIDSDVDMTWSA